MGRAESRFRERHGRLSPRPSPHPSRFRPFRFARGWRAAVCALAAVLFLLPGAETAHAQDTTAPTVISVAVNGTTLTVTFNERLDIFSTTVGTAFVVSATPSGGTTAR